MAKHLIGDIPLSEPMMDKISDAIWQHKTQISEILDIILTSQYLNHADLLLNGFWRTNFNKIQMYKFPFKVSHSLPASLC